MSLGDKMKCHWDSREESRTDWLPLRQVAYYGKKGRAGRRERRAGGGADASGARVEERARA